MSAIAGSSKPTEGSSKLGQFSRVRGTIKRRLLVNFRADPAAIQKILPRPFRPKLQAGHAIAGICLIRLEGMRPHGIPQAAGLSSENAAHRIAVVWDDIEGPKEGVYIPRRDTGSLLNHLAGGRLFREEYHHAKFQVTDTAGRIDFHMRSDDGEVEVDLLAKDAEQLPETSIFQSIEEASAFFQSGGLGYSATKSGRLDGIILKTESWSVAPLAVERVHSSYFENKSVFPPGSIRIVASDFLGETMARNLSNPAKLYSTLKEKMDRMLAHLTFSRETYVVAAKAGWPVQAMAASLLEEFDLFAMALPAPAQNWFADSTRKSAIARYKAGHPRPAVTSASTPKAIRRPSGKETIGFDAAVKEEI